MKISLKTKFIILSTLTVTVIMTTVTYFFTIRELEARRAAVESQIRRIAQNIATLQLLEQQDWNVYQDYITQLMAFNEDIVFIAIYDDRNTLRAHTINTNLIELDKPLRSRRMQAELVRRLDSGAVSTESRSDLRSERVNILVGDRVLGSVHVGFSLIDINDELRKGIGLNITLGLFFIALFLSISIFFSRRLTRPLEQLSMAMEAVNKGDLDQKVKPQTRDEIAQLTRTFNEMIDGLRERQIIEKLGGELSATFQMENLAMLVRESLKNAIGAAGARLYIRLNSDGAMFYEVTGQRKDEQDFPPLIIDGGVKEFIVERQSGFLIHSAPETVMQALKHHQSDEAGLVVPMMVKNELFGMLFFALPTQQENFSEKQIHFASTLANQAALALENALLYEELREQERFKRELEIAREVQQKLLPTRMPTYPGYQFDAVCESAQEVGGDYFDFFPLENDLLGIVIADVSGKGTSASFYMAELKGMMLQLTSNFTSPRSLLIELNKKLFWNLERRIFVTMIYGIMDFKTNRFTFARAGHNALLKIGTNGDHRFLTPAGIGLGLESGKIFEEKLEEANIELKSRETLLLYTDGITEAMNPQQQEFGEERLLESCLKSHSINVSEKKKSILASVKHFMKGASTHDDITMVLLQYSGE